MSAFLFPEVLRWVVSDTPLPAL
uniref:Uncharacterized protein n=1 Tax=Arundo donax TaxID=35708 RepID=A0A0A9B490_ARUDO